MSPTVRSYLAELLGTFTLVFIGTAVATLQGGPLGGAYGPAGLIMISFAFGGTLMVLVNVIGPVSGCHVNPAVTIAMAASGRLPGTQAPGYIVSQCVGATLASVVLKTLLSGLGTYNPETHGLAANGFGVGQAGMAFGWEVVLTALFLFTIFSATRSDFKGSTPLAIGGFLFVAHLVGAQLGDSSVNPARSLGPALIQGGQALKDVWVFIVAPIVGGLVGWVAYKVIYAD